MQHLLLIGSVPIEQTADVGRCVGSSGSQLAVDIVRCVPLNAELNVGLLAVVGQLAWAQAWLLV
jgi:hypothetical protein